MTWRDTGGPVQIDEFDIEKHRERLRKMTDKQLLETGRSAKYMCSPQANFQKPPREVFVIQLAEARAEWRRRQELNGAQSRKHRRRPTAQRTNRGSHNQGAN
jgi:hypothetical protein